MSLAMSMASAADDALGMLANLWLVNSKCSSAGGGLVASGVGARDVVVRFRGIVWAGTKSETWIGRWTLVARGVGCEGATSMSASGSGELGAKTGLLGTTSGVLCMESLLFWCGMMARVRRSLIRMIAEILSYLIVRASHNENSNDEGQENCNGLRATTRRRREVKIEIWNKTDERNRMMSKSR